MYALNQEVLPQFFAFSQINNYNNIKFYFLLLKQYIISILMFNSIYLQFTAFVADSKNLKKAVKIK